jgi:hypothetical protein
MKYCKLLSLLLLILTGLLYAQTVDIIIDDGELFLPDDQDQRLIREFLEDKRDETLAEKPELRISGDIRVRYRNRSEKINGREVTQKCAFRTAADGTRQELVFPGVNFSDDRDRIEANVQFDYSSDCAWGAIKIELENELGKISGTKDRINLERALIGYDLYKCGNTRWFIEAGRQFLLEKFRSEIQYGSRLDGIFTRYDTCVSWLGPVYVQGAGMVVDYRCDEYAWAGAVAFDNIHCTKWYTIYSYVDWGRHRSDDLFPLIIRRDPFSDTIITNTPARIRPYRISQFIVGRRIPCFVCDKELNLFAAVIYNHAAKGVVVTRGRKEALGWYAGFQLGKVKKKHDWAVIFEFDYVEAQAILESDNSGIGRGNAQNRSLYEGLIAANARGDTNYYGPGMEVAYAATNDLTFRAQLVYSKSIANDIGGEVRFRQFDFQAIYAF